MKSRTSDANRPAMRIFSISWAFLIVMDMVYKGFGEAG
jgi:hypothetical protein